MSTIGIDLGNSKCVVAAARKRGIDIILNNASNRETPTAVTFLDSHRLIGTTTSTNPTNSITDIKRLLGRTVSDLADDLPLLPFKVTPDPDDLPLVHVNYLDAETTFTPTQILAMVLSHLKSQAERHLDSRVDGCCIGIPSHFTDLQRRAVLDASAIAGLRTLRLIHEGTAVALDYGMYNASEFRGQTKNAAFVDVGHASTQVCVVYYSGVSMNVLAHVSDRSLGGRDFDEVLFRHFAAKFEKDCGLDVRTKARACVRLRMECENLKKVLSANAEASLNVEGLMGDHDLRGSIKRDEFERLSGPLLERIGMILRKAVADAGLCPEFIDVVEVIGSGSLVPAIVRVVKDSFGKEPKRTMNASECVARGCALQCAILSPRFEVRTLEVHEKFPFDINVLWRFPFSNDTCELTAFSKGNLMPSKNNLQLFGEDSFAVDLVYMGEYETERKGTNAISTYKIGPCQLTKHESAAFEIEVFLDPNGIVHMRSVTMLREVGVSKSTSEVPVVTNMEIDPPRAHSQPKVTAGEASKDIEIDDEEMPFNSHDEVAHSQQNGESNSRNESTDVEALAEVEHVKEKKRESIVFFEFIHGGISPKQLEEAIEKEQEMTCQDRLVEETKDKRNEVERYVYDMRRKIREEYRAFIDELERTKFSLELQMVENWLYEDGQGASRDEYIGKLKELKEHGDPIEMRYKEDLERDPAVNKLREHINKYRGLIVLDNLQDDTEKVLNACENAEDWLNSKLKLQHDLPAYQDPVLFSSDINEHLQELDRDHNQGVVMTEDTDLLVETDPSNDDQSSVDKCGNYDVIQ